MVQIQHYIGGAFHDSQETLANINPAIGQEIGRIPRADKAQIGDAVAAASDALDEWASLKPEERAHWLELLAKGIESRFDDFCQAEVLDTGKPLSLVKMVDIPRSIQNLRFYASAALQFSSESYHGSAGLNYVRRKPRGVAAAISPWNLPLYLFTWKIAPALASGTTVVAKPSEVTPTTAFMLSQVCHDIGLPKGVLNIVHGYGHEAGHELIVHPKVPTITFTGGSQTGRGIASLAGGMLKKYSLELGGKNPSIIFADCDFGKMLTTTVRSSFTNQGQICLCGSRILIERPLFQKFKEAFVEKASQLVVGDPFDAATNLGSLVSKAHYDKVSGAIDLAKQEGGQCLLGGEALSMPPKLQDGYYIGPTIFEGLGPDCQTNQAEIFGPVVTLTPFDTEEEAIALANGTEYGLAANIWTSHLNRAHRMAESIDTGIVWINTWLHRDLRTPFGGMKSSGVGREGGFEAMKFFTEPKTVCLDLS